jgi:hypothetical protein
VDFPGDDFDMKGKKISLDQYRKGDVARQNKEVADLRSERDAGAMDDIGKE